MTLSLFIPKPNRSEGGKIIGDFYPLQRQELLAWKKTGMIKGAAYVGMCLRLENPFFDKPVRINVEAFCQKWEVSESQYFKSLRQLKSHGFLTISRTESFICLSTVQIDSDCPNRQSTVQTDSQTVQTDSQTVQTDSQTVQTDSQTVDLDNFRCWEPATEEDLKDHTPQTYSDLIRFNSDFSQTAGKSENGTATPNQRESGVIEVDSTTTKDVNSQSVKSDIYSKGSLSAAPRDPFFNQKPRSQDLLWNWVPDGPWRCENGTLDNSFVDFHARRWMQKYTNCVDIHDARGNVRAYFKNDPTRLANDWQTYQEYNVIKVANMGLREKHGVKVHEEERAAIAQHRNAFKENPHAITAPNTGEVEQYKQWIDQAPAQQLGQGKQTIYIEAEREIDWDAIASQTEDFEKRHVSVIPEGAENPQAYLNTPKEEDREYYRRLYEERDAVRKDSQNAGNFPPSGQIENVGTMIADYIKESHNMKQLSRQEVVRLKEKQRESTRVAHWNGLLASGLESCIYEATRQARAAGYEVIDGQVVGAEF